MCRDRKQRPELFSENDYVKVYWDGKLEVLIGEKNQYIIKVRETLILVVTKKIMSVLFHQRYQEEF